MSLRLLGIDPDTGYRMAGNDTFAMGGSGLRSSIFGGPSGLDPAGAIGVGPMYNPSSDEGFDSSRIEDAKRTVQGRAAQGDGNHYRPHPGLPSMGVLDYVQKFSTATLVSIGLLVMLIVFLRDPKGAGRWIARSGTRRAGLE